VGGLKRLSVAVVVNFKKTIGKDGKVKMVPLTADETTQITNLVKEAMGFNQTRGDSLNVVNSAFASPEQEILPETPIWKESGTIQIAKDIGKYILMGIALLLLYLRVLKPMLKKISEPAAPAPAMDMPIHSSPQMEAGMGEGSKGGRGYQDGLARAQKLASEDPRVVANIVKTWVGSNE
jgi:flagellar M-ring protein FliF